MSMPRLFRLLLPILALLVGCPPLTERVERLFAPPAPTRGLDPERLARAEARLAALPRFHALVVARDGQVFAARRFRGPSLETPVNIKSASKSVLSALVGAAIARGVLGGLDEPAARYLERDFPADPDPRLREITIGDLLSMRSGLARTSGSEYGAWVASANWVRDALARPMAGNPGGRMLYSTGNSHLLSAVLTRASGRSTHDLARDWLAEPLGVALPPWPRDPQGIYFGGNDMLLSPLAMLRFGELYRMDGMFEGRRVLPEGWVEATWKPLGFSAWSGHGYGYGWFAGSLGGQEAHFAWGYGGQMIYVLPKLRLTVAMTSDPTPHPRAESHISTLHAVVAEEIVPAAIKGAPPEDEVQRAGSAESASRTAPGVRSSGSSTGASRPGT